MAIQLGIVFLKLIFCSLSRNELLTFSFSCHGSTVACNIVKLLFFLPTSHFFIYLSFVILMILQLRGHNFLVLLFFFFWSLIAVIHGAILPFLFCCPSNPLYGRQYFPIRKQALLLNMHKSCKQRCTFPNDMANGRALAAHTYNNNNTHTHTHTHTHD